jgi:hypothetical protein
MPYKDKDKQLAAQRKFYSQNKEKSRIKVRDRRSNFRKIIEQAKSVPCMDCGVCYPYYVMDFDHRPDSGKIANISGCTLMTFPSEEKLLAEIAKCDVVCSNCHRRRTWNRARKVQPIGDGTPLEPGRGATP